MIKKVISSLITSALTVASIASPLALPDVIAAQNAAQEAALAAAEEEALNNEMPIVPNGDPSSANRLLSESYHIAVGSTAQFYFREGYGDNVKISLRECDDKVITIEGNSYTGVKAGYACIYFEYEDGMFDTAFVSVESPMTTTPSTPESSIVATHVADYNATAGSQVTIPVNMRTPDQILINIDDDDKMQLVRVEKIGDAASNIILKALKVCDTNVNVNFRDEENQEYSWRFGYNITDSALTNGINEITITDTITENDINHVTFADNGTFLLDGLTNNFQWCKKGQKYAITFKWKYNENNAKQIVNVSKVDESHDSCQICGKHIEPDECVKTNAGMYVCSDCFSEGRGVITTPPTNYQTTTTTITTAPKTTWVTYDTYHCIPITTSIYEDVDIPTTTCTSTGWVVHPGTGNDVSISTNYNPVTNYSGSSIPYYMTSSTTTVCTTSDYDEPVFNSSGIPYYRTTSSTSCNSCTTTTNWVVYPGTGNDVTNYVTDCNTGIAGSSIPFYMTSSTTDACTTSTGYGTNHCIPEDYTSTTITETTTIIEGRIVSELNDTIVEVGDNFVEFKNAGIFYIQLDQWGTDKGILTFKPGDEICLRYVYCPLRRSTITSVLELYRTSVSSYLGTAKGDANGDNNINMADAIFIMQAILNPDEFRPDMNDANGAQLWDNCDVFGNDGVTLGDAERIQEFLLGLIDKLY